MIIMAVALIALPTLAQNQEWLSTSTMQTSGSVYSSQVNAVGAVGVSSMATTTESYSPAYAPGGPRRNPISGDNEGWVDGADEGQTELSPLGDAVLPMMIMAMLFAGVVYLRRKKA